MVFLARHARAKKFKNEKCLLNKEIRLNETIHGLGRVALEKFLREDQTNSLLFKDEDFTCI